MQEAEGKAAVVLCGRCSLLLPCFARRFLFILDREVFPVFWKLVMISVPTQLKRFSAWPCERCPSPEIQGRFGIWFAHKACGLAAREGSVPCHADPWHSYRAPRRALRSPKLLL